MVRNVFKSEHLYRYSKENSTPVGTSTYEALYPNLIWHVDVHFWDGDQHYPIFALIDDYSRKIMTCKLIENHQAATVLQVFQEAAEEYGNPYAIWSDNGSENKGIFNQYLMEQHIAHVVTRPHCSQQNGKIERFWQTLEKLTNENGLSIEAAIETYNNTTHQSLPYMTVDIEGRNLKCHLTPNQRYLDGDCWDPTKRPQWKVNGIIKDFIIQDN